ncbi:MAG: hypothetical protein RLN85_20515, partial [Pseudomonadales bacterium]
LGDLNSFVGSCSLPEEEGCDSQHINYNPVQLDCFQVKAVLCHREIRKGTLCRGRLIIWSYV